MQTWEFSDNWEYRVIRGMTGLAKALAEKDEIRKSHQLAPSPIRRLNIKINDFNLDYMYMVCLGVVRRMLHYFK